MCTCLIVLMRLHNLESLGGENTLSIQKGNWWGGGGAVSVSQAIIVGS